jgi:type II secretory pathway pseudopilin PulG
MFHVAEFVRIQTSRSEFGRIQLRRRRSLKKRPSGLTLVELWLVLAILVAIAAITAPAMQGTFSRTALNSGSAIVREAFAKGRLAAVQTGKTHVFRFEQKGARYQLIDLDALSLPENSSLSPEDKDDDHSPSDMLRLHLTRLPDNVIFAAGNVSASNQVAAMLGSPKDNVWSPPVLFNPDGTTSDASVLLQNDRGQTVRVTLRGLTGIASASDIGREAAP